MALIEFVPLNPLELALVDAMAGKMEMAYFLRQFVASKIAIPSAKEVQADGSGISPVFYEKLGTQIVAVFTDLDLAKIVGVRASDSGELS